MGRWDVAQDHSVEAEKDDPQSKKAHTRLGLVLDKSGDHAGARAHFNRALGLEKNNVDTQNSEILKKHVEMYGVLLAMDAACGHATFAGCQRRPMTSNSCSRSL